MKQVIYGVMVVSGLLVSCRQPKDLVYKSVQNFGLQKGKALMDISFYNPNKYKLKLKNADLDVFLNGAKLGKMNVSKAVVIPRMDTFTVPVSIDVDLKNLLPNALQLAFSSDMSVKLQGNLKAGRHGVYKNVPVNYEGKQDIRKGLGW
jgi:LEA14-like dessication related protein